MGLLVSGRSELAGATAGRTETRADAGGVWGAAGWQPAITVVFAQPGRKPGSVGRITARPLSAGAGRPEPVAGGHRWVPGISGSPADRLSPGAASALLGAQDAQHFEEGAEARLRDREAGSASDLSRRDPAGSASSLLHFSESLAGELSHGRSPAGEGSSRAALFLPLPPPSLEEAAHHQRDRTVLCRGAPPHASHGLLRQ